MTNNVSEGHREKQSYANTRTTGKEQYYTNSDVVDLCIEKVKEHIDLSQRFILEPAGGTGEFVNGFLRNGVNPVRILSFDIEPKHAMVMEGDFLETKLQSENFVCITNPPFGRASALAKKFFEHASQYCEYICFLVPRSWRKWTVINSLNKHYHLVSDTELPQNCFYTPGDTETKKDVLNTVFQIWKRHTSKRKEIKIPDNNLVKKLIPKKKKVKVYRKVKEDLFKLEGDEYVKVEKECFEMVVQSRPDKIKGANFQMIVFGHSCGNCEELDPLTQYDAKTTTMYFYIERDDVKSALKNLDFSRYFNNVAYVQALSLQEINYELNKHFGLPNFKF